jgi:hypothetical protein
MVKAHFCFTRFIDEEEEKRARQGLEQISHAANFSG